MKCIYLPGSPASPLYEIRYKLNQITLQLEPNKRVVLEGKHPFGRRNQ